MADSKQSFATTGRSRKGEPLVWLTAAGLSIGVALTLALLGLVVVKGMESFWPSRVMVFEVEQDGQKQKVAGYVSQERERRDMSGEYHEEIQVFRGNRDLYGETFIFLDQAQVKSTSEPKDLLVVERLEGGGRSGGPWPLNMVAARAWTLRIPTSWVALSRNWKPMRRCAMS